MPRPARTAPRSPALALLTWLLCALLAPGPALPAVHFALVAHRVCPEHGELEHVGSDAELSERTLGSAAPATGQAQAANVASADDHGHEPCGVGGAGGKLAVLPAARCTSVAPLAHALPAPSGTDRAHQGIALLRYAPKLAPPAHA